MAKGDPRHSWGEMKFHPENDGACIIVHQGKEVDGGKVAWGPDATVEFRWKDLVEGLGAKNAAQFHALIDKMRELARAKVPALKTSTFVKPA